MLLLMAIHKIRSLKIDRYKIPMYRMANLKSYLNFSCSGTLLYKPIESLIFNFYSYIQQHGDHIHDADHVMTVIKTTNRQCDRCSTI